jgi:hypothetical protein
VIDSIHQSSLNMALRCGEQLRRRYIEDEIIPPGVAAGRGTGVHKANEVNLKQKIVSQKDLPLSDMQDAARDGFVNAFRNGVYLTGEDVSKKETIINDALNDCIRCTGIYANEVAPHIEPVEVEVPFEVDIGLSLVMKGRIDYSDNNEVNDLKTSKKSWSDGQIEKEIQPIFYSMAHEKQKGTRPVFNYHILVPLKTKDKYMHQSITPTDAMYAGLVMKMRMFCKMIESGTFLPANPSSWWCCEKWCGYYKTCIYVGNRPAKIWL